jgi:hypothetical protein
MLYTLADRWGHGSRIVVVVGTAYRVTGSGRRWTAAVRCTCPAVRRPHWHDVIARRSERALRVALTATAITTAA